MASKSLYSPFDFDFGLRSEWESTDELPLLFVPQSPLHLVWLLPSLLKLAFAISLSCFGHSFSYVSEVLLFLTPGIFFSICACFRSFASVSEG
ncbi:hypothetical protein V6N13_035310 [Hibiscus sabdariffa]|uniref:Uncharacterized protein n=1 Tax=Hibiscus sabdariffa TaxID=183260 RepID=A0ABR2SAM1_9ROSI